MFVRDVKFVKVDSEASMRQLGFNDEAIIYTLDNQKFFQFDLFNNQFIPITLQTLITNNTTNEVIGVTEDQVFKDIFSVTDEIRDLLDRLLLDLTNQGFELKDEKLLKELEIFINNKDVIRN